MGHERACVVPALVTPGNHAFSAPEDCRCDTPLTRACVVRVNFYNLRESGPPGACAMYSNMGWQAWGHLGKFGGRVCRCSLDRGESGPHVPRSMALALRSWPAWDGGCLPVAVSARVLTEHG